MIFDVFNRLSDGVVQLEVVSITAFTSVLVAVIGIFTAHRFTHPRKPTMSSDDSNKNKRESLLANYSGEQNEFIHLVIQDSKELHARLDRNDEVIAQMRKERQDIIGAFGRYIAKLARAWGNGAKMPYPDKEDFPILKDTLPMDWRGNSN